MSFEGTARLLLEAVKKSVEDHARDLAAAIAYWSFFSLFPLAIAILSVAGFFLGSAEAQAQVFRIVQEAFPGSAEFVQELVADVVAHRGTLGFVGVLGLLWSASKGFAAVTRAVDRAIGDRPGHPPFFSRLRHLGVTVVCTIMVLIAVAAATAFEVLLRPALFEPLGVDFPLLSRVQSEATNLLIAVLVFAVIYKITPYERPGWAQVLPGALLAAVLFELLKAGFVVYLDWGIGFEAVYGSVSSIIVLLLWLYLSAWVLILGAEFCIVRHRARSPAFGDAAAEPDADG